MRGSEKGRKEYIWFIYIFIPTSRTWLVFFLELGFSLSFSFFLPPSLFLVPIPLYLLCLCICGWMDRCVCVSVCLVRVYIPEPSPLWWWLGFLGSREAKTEKNRTMNTGRGHFPAARCSSIILLFPPSSVHRIGHRIGITAVHSAVVFWLFTSPLFAHMGPRSASPCVSMRRFWLKSNKGKTHSIRMSGRVARRLTTSSLRPTIGYEAGSLA